MSDTNDPTGSIRQEDDDDNATKSLWETKHAPGAALIGQTVGHYRITGIIGQGGMGVVYEAEQEHPKRAVALKVINPGVTSERAIRRFEHEAQVLGLLQHSGIAQIYEAGTFDLGAGMQPFFAMEYVRGVPLTECAERSQLSTHERLELIVKICRAVQHAHQKGIIHRDLKPGNILVTDDGEPKVLDFGVARATDSDIQTTTLQTDIGQLIGTIPYMSPEQAGGDPNELDTRSDVYALGVVAYELLAGRLPYNVQQKMVHEAVRVIREEDPTPLSSTNRTLRGDVEIIVGKALEKEKDRRYQSALEFASDIERYLHDEPIVARPPSAAYQLRKFARRNKALVGGVTTTFVVLVAGLVGMSILYAQAEEARAAEVGQRRIAEAREQEAVVSREAEAEQRRIAEEREAEALAAREEAETARAAETERAEQLEKVAAFQASQLSEIDTAMMGINLRLGLIEKRRAFLEDRGMDEDKIKAGLAELESSLTGINFTNVALETLDENIFERALIAIDEQFEDELEIRARLLQAVADTLRGLGLLNRAYEPQNQALNIRRNLLGDDHPDTLLSLGNKGVLLVALGRLNEAEPYYAQSLEGRRRVLGEDHRMTLTAINNMGFLLSHQGRFEDAEQYFRLALERRRSVLGEKHYETLGSISSLAVALKEQGRFDDAEPLFREAETMSRLALGDDHIQTIMAIGGLGVFLQESGRLAEAEPYYLETLERRIRVLGDEHPETLVAMSNMGVLLSSQGKLDEAEPYYRRSLDIRTRLQGEDHPSTQLSLNNLAVLLVHMGRLGEAEPLFRGILDFSLRVLGEQHPDTLLTLNNLAVVLSNADRFDEAEEVYRDGLDMAQRNLGDQHPEVLRLQANLGQLLQRQGRLDDAEPYIISVYEGRRDLYGHDHPLTLIAMVNVGAQRAWQGRHDEAEPIFREVLSVRRATLGDGHQSTLDVMNHLCMALLASERFKEVLPLAHEAVEHSHSFADNGFRTGIFLTHYARALFALERFADAEEKAIEGHRHLARSIGANQDRTRTLAEVIAQIYDAWHAADADAGHNVQAAEWRAKLSGSSDADDDTDGDGESND